MISHRNLLRFFVSPSIFQRSTPRENGGLHLDQQDLGRRLLQSLRSERAEVERSTSMLTADPAIAAVYRESQVEEVADEPGGVRVGDLEVQSLIDLITWK